MQRVSALVAGCPRPVNKQVELFKDPVAWFAIREDYFDFYLDFFNASYLKALLHRALCNPSGEVEFQSFEQLIHQQVDC